MDRKLLGSSEMYCSKRWWTSVGANLWKMKKYYKTIQGVKEHLTYGKMKKG